MKDFMRSLWGNQAKTVPTTAQIDAAYEKRAKEIESLRKYDRGEKEISAPNLRDIAADVPAAR